MPAQKKKRDTRPWTAILEVTVAPRPPEAEEAGRRAWDALMASGEKSLARDAAGGGGFDDPANAG